ncbi:MAG: hypothetical protein NTZ55_05115 [Candidatus Roizmanbacteria bacterium]|nr:hypothetical protein [Candidatus Roizmanbacteria bacterium]
MGALEQRTTSQSVAGDSRASLGGNLLRLAIKVSPVLLTVGCVSNSTQMETPPPLPTPTSTTTPTEEPTRTPDPDLTTPAYCSAVGESGTITATVPKALEGTGETAQTVGDWFLSLNTAGNIYTADAGDVLNGATGDDNFTFVNAKSVICLSENKTSAAIHAASAAPVNVKP